MDVKLPNLGEGADSGTVVSILVNEGEQILVGQNLIELENGKAVVPVPSPAAGKVSHVRVKVGDKVSVGNVIVTLDAASGTVATASGAPARSEQAPRAAEKPSAPRHSSEEVAADEADAAALAARAA